MRRIRSRTSRGTDGRPGLPLRIFHVQKRRNAFRCQATTVSGLTMTSEDHQSDQIREGQTQQEAIGAIELWTLTCRALQHTDLMAQRDVLQL